MIDRPIRNELFKMMIFSVQNISRLWILEIKNKFVVCFYRKESALSQKLSFFQKKTCSDKMSGKTYELLFLHLQLLCSCCFTVLLIYHTLQCLLINFWVFFPNRIFCWISWACFQTVIRSVINGFMKNKLLFIKNTVTKWSECKNFAPLFLTAQKMAKP